MTIQRPARILVVEDNPADLELIAYLLKAHGFGVIEATSGHDAVKVVAREWPIDLALLDIRMPGMDGLELASVLRRLPHLRTVPFVAVTALASQGDRDRALAAGFDGYIPKPIEPECFVPEIERFLAA